jgi:hypothetical protein
VGQKAQAPAYALPTVLRSILLQEDFQSMFAGSMREPLSPSEKRLGRALKMKIIFNGPHSSGVKKKVSRKK